jgi:hypothetical protein
VGEGNYGSLANEMLRELECHEALLYIFKKIRGQPLSLSALCAKVICPDTRTRRFDKETNGKYTC